MRDKHIKVLKIIAEDMRKDAEHYEGQEFNGRNVAEWCGKLGAAIAGVANIMRANLEKTDEI